MCVKERERQREINKDIQGQRDRDMARRKRVRETMTVLEKME